ncbi:MAG: exosortase/archaeosortase family protein [Chloroflexi bacterium]|nr:exosortase/archaeosortase family protein [Chloroflexota bacterium]
MNIVAVNGVKSWLETRAARKLVLWLLLSVMLSLVFFRELWTSLPTMISPDVVLGQQRASTWGVLALCLLFLWLKRKEIWKGISRESSLIFVPVGLALVASAVLMPSYKDYLVFQVLLASLGVFVALFGKGARLPSIVLVIYGFAVSFPIGVQRFLEGPYQQTAFVPLTGLMRAMGYPLRVDGQWLHFTSTGGEPISVVVTMACAGPATRGVFIALFALMMLDMPLSPRKAAWLFLFGAVGTWFQNIIRLVFLILMGYYLGRNALWTAHYWTTYILFPLWYLFFAYIYFRQVGRPPGIRKGRNLSTLRYQGATSETEQE